MYMDLNLETLVEATQENQEAHHQQVLGQKAVQETAVGSLLDGRHRDGKREVADGVEREHMFDKVVTPSDVGKLNRLVVPKQHAERYFPAAAAAGPSAGQLCFEDRAGTPWRFRYSYWGSSQSYVMTKGWSRFVRAARLAAGDTVSFSRGAGGRYFIDYRQRQRRGGDMSFGAAAPAAWQIVGGVQKTAASEGTATMILDTAPVVAGDDVEVGSTGTRSFRLFGVNVECGGDAVAAAEEERNSEERELVVWRKEP